MAGFTTVQSVGSPMDVPLRDEIAKGALPGPRILTAVEPLEGRGEKTGTPDEIRASQLVHELYLGMGTPREWRDA